MTPEILIVGDPAGRRKLADLIAASGYGVALCAAHEVNRRIRTGPAPGAIVACMADLDADVVLAGLRRTRAGASIPVILYGRLGGQLRDLADVLDIGADHFIEEPAREHELRDALAQFVQPAEAPATRGRGRGRERDDEHWDDEPRDRGPREERSGARDDRGGPDPREAREDWDDRPEPPRSRGPRRPRGAALSELHQTLERLDASLRGDEQSDPELSELGLDQVPNVDDPLDEEPLVTEIGEHLRRPRERERERDDYPEEQPSGRRPPRTRTRDPEPERARPSGRWRQATDRIEDREDEGRARSGRGRARRREPDEDSSGTTAEIGRERTRSWDRPVSEGPLRRGRERNDSPSPRASTRSPARPERDRSERSAVLRGRRPGREDASESTGRVDPHAREVPWPTDDFDPSESTMIRRERSSSTIRRRSAGGWRRGGGSGEESKDISEFPWGSSRSSETSRSTTRGRPPEPNKARRREAPPRERDEPRTRARDDSRPRDEARSRKEPRTRDEPRLDEARPRLDRDEEAPRSSPTVTPATAKPMTPARRSRRSSPARGPQQTRLRIDPSLSESGKLSDEVDVATVLWALHEQRFTGKLRLKRARVEKQVWLHDGEAVFARSTATSDRLVDGLLRRGVLTRPQYETARRLAAKEPRRAGQLLVDAGFLKARELDVVLRDHLARVIDATFVWTEGSWASEPGERTDEPIQLEVPMAALVLDGVRYRCDSSELEDRLTQRIGGRGPLVPRLRAGTGELGEDRSAAVDALLDTLGESFRLLPEEESWLRRFDGRHGVAALLADGADEQALFALLFTLDLGGYVDLREEAEPLVESDRDPAQVDSERILERLRLAREADYFELLGLGRDASGNEIRQAHSSLSTTFSDESLESDSRQRHARELRELRTALEEARDILSDDAMRSAYLAHLGDGT